MRDCPQCCVATRASRTAGKMCTRRVGLLLVLACVRMAADAHASVDDAAKDPVQSLVHAETNLLQLVDDVLPRSQQRRVRLRDHHQLHPKKPAMAGPDGTRRESRQGERSSRLQTRSAPWERRTLVHKVHILIHNALANAQVVNVTMDGGAVTRRLYETNMRYGDSREAECELGLDDVLTVSTDKQQYSQTIREKIFRVPDNAESFIVPDQTQSGRLHTSITIYDLDISFSVQHSWLMTYNALLGPELGKTFGGVDVIIFDASKYRVDYSLHRIARNVSLHKGQEALAPEGSYELKVIPHGHAVDVYQFKNAKSLLPPIYITLLGGKRHYVTLQGKVGSEEYPPQLQSVPTIQIAPPPVQPKTPLIALNAYSEQGMATIMFPKYNITIDLPSRAGVEEVIYLKRGDVFNVTTNSGQRHGFVIDTEVPYRDGECALIPDRSRTGKLEAFFSCWYRFAQPLPRTQFWIFAYHALLGYDNPVDWVVFDESALKDNQRHSLFSLGDKLFLTQGVASRVDVGNYSLKVVPHGSVFNPESFRNTPSLIEPTYISPQAATRYYAVIQGDHHKHRGLFTSYPAMPVVHGPAGSGTGSTDGQGPSSSSSASTPSPHPALLLLALSVTYILYHTAAAAAGS